MHGYKLDESLAWSLDGLEYEEYNVLFLVCLVGFIDEYLSSDFSCEVDYYQETKNCNFKKWKKVTYSPMEKNAQVYGIKSIGQPEPQTIQIMEHFYDSETPSQHTS